MVAVDDRRAIMLIETIRKHEVGLSFAPWPTLFARHLGVTNDELERHFVCNCIMPNETIAEFTYRNGLKLRRPYLPLTMIALGTDCAKQVGASSIHGKWTILNEMPPLRLTAMPHPLTGWWDATEEKAWHIFIRAALNRALDEEAGARQVSTP